jgi:hypothetical protein
MEVQTSALGGIWEAAESDAWARINGGAYTTARPKVGT